MPKPEQSWKARAAFESLLCSLFSQREFRTFIGRVYEPVSDSLPGEPCTLQSLVHLSVAALDRRRVIDTEFLKALLEERPKAQNEIRTKFNAWKPNTQRDLPEVDDPDRRELSNTIYSLYAKRNQIVRTGGDPEEVAKLENSIAEQRQKLRRGGLIRTGDFFGNGRYLLLGRLGDGGFGTVWRAYDHEQDDIVALKILHSHAAADAATLKRFIHGSRKMAQLDHPNIVKVFRTAFEDEGHYAYIMEFIEGQDLGTLRERSRLTDKDFIEIFVDVCGALQYAHDNDFVHRDIKPTNVIVNEQKVPFLTDFDLVLVLDQTRFTATNARMGTIAFAAPEALEDARCATARSDIYSLGLSLLSCLTRSNPPVPLNATARLSWISQLGTTSRVRLVCEKATSTHPAERHSSVLEVQRALIECLITPSFSSTPQTVDEPYGSHPVESNFWTWVFGVVIFVLMFALIYFMIQAPSKIPSTGNIPKTTKSLDKKKRPSSTPSVTPPPPVTHPSKLVALTSDEMQSFIDNTYGDVARCAINNHIPEQTIFVFLEFEERTGKVKPTIKTDVGNEKFDKCVMQVLLKRKVRSGRKVNTVMAQYQLNLE